MKEAMNGFRIHINTPSNSAKDYLIRKLSPLINGPVSNAHPDTGR